MSRSARKRRRKQKDIDRLTRAAGFYDRAVNDLTKHYKKSPIGRARFTWSGNKRSQELEKRVNFLGGILDSWKGGESRLFHYFPRKSDRAPWGGDRYNS